MLDPVYEAFGSALAFFYAIVPNLGVAIILLTVTVMLLLFPLTAKSARSMLAMQRLQPEIKKLQAKHKGDRQKLNEEMMKLYQEHKVNPLGGCLPLLLQMPVFIALFSVLRNPATSVPESSALYAAIQAAKPKGLTFLGMDLTVKATDSHGGFIDALPYYILVGLVVLTGFIQSRQTARNTPPGANQQMLIIGKVLPVFFGLISLNFPSGLVLYFFVSNLWRVGQQELIMRHIAPRDHLVAKSGKKPGAIDVKGTESKPRRAQPAADPPAVEAGAKSEPQTEPTAESGTAGASDSVEEAAPRPSGLGGGLRALFRPPPGPSNGDAEAPSKPAPKPASTPRPAGQQRQNPRSTRAGQSRAQRRRSSNKKRKR